MTVIATRLFGGETPKLPANILPDSGAQLAIDCNLAHGDVRPLNGLALKTRLATAGTIRNLYSEDGINFYTWQDNGFAVRSPQKEDAYGRFYYTIEDNDGGGTTPFGMYVYTKSAFGSVPIGVQPSINPRGGSPAQRFWVGVPKPANKPVLSAVDADNFPGVTSSTISLNFFYEKDGKRFQQTNDIPVPALGQPGVAPFNVTTTSTLRGYTITVPAIVGGTIAPGGTAQVFIVSILYDDGTGQATMYLGQTCTVLGASTLQTGSGTVITGVISYTDSDGNTKTLGQALAADANSAATPDDAVPVIEVTFTDTSSTGATTPPKNSVLFHGFSSNSSQVNNGSSAAGGAPTINMVKVSSTGLDYTIDVDYPIYETRAYFYTAVNAWGEESIPSDPELISISYAQTVNVLISYANQVGYKEQTKGRIYRTAQSNAGASAYQLVNADDIFDIYTVNGALVQFTYNDSVPTERLQETCPSTTWDAPPNVLHNITAMPNGVLAAFVGNQLYFSDPYHPFAWPVDYIKTFPYDIIGLKVSGSSLVVTTKAYPFVVTGVHPDSMSDEQLPLLQAGVSPYGMADMGNQVAYVSNDGIVVVQGTTGSMGFSTQLFTREDWKSRYDNPNGSPATYLNTWRLGVYDGALIAVSEFAPGFIIRLDEDVGIFTRFSPLASAVFLIPQTDTFCIAQGGSIYAINEGATSLQFVWTSKDHIVTRPTNFGVCQVIASPGPKGGGSLLVTTIADGVTRSADSFTVTRDSENFTFRLPSGFLARRYAVSLSGDCTVKELYLANIPQELQGA